MKNRVLIVIILIFIVISGNGQKQLNMNGISNEQDTGKVERYNYEATEGGTKRVMFKRDEWIIVIRSMPGGWQDEYAPARDFYNIQTDYYNNGVIKERGKYLGDVPFGLWEYFDESGKLVKTVDEDAKFGKVKPADIVAFMERQGIFNRETGESIFHKTPLPTDGNFYREVSVRLEIALIDEKEMVPENTGAKKMRKQLKMGRYEHEKKFIPVWSVSYRIGIEITTYYIDGNDINNFFMEKDTYNYTL